MNRNAESVQNETPRDEECRAQEICLHMDDISIEAAAPVSDSEHVQNVTDDDSTAENELQEIEVEGNQADGIFDDDDAMLIIMEDPIDSEDNIEAVAETVAPNNHLCDGSSDCCASLYAVLMFFLIIFGTIVVLGGGTLLLQFLFS